MLTRAGERAASLAASEEALRYFERAAGLADAPLEEAALRERAGEMAWAGGNAEIAREELGRALALFDAAGETHPAARLHAPRRGRVAERRARAGGRPHGGGIRGVPLYLRAQAAATAGTAFRRARRGAQRRAAPEICGESHADVVAAGS